MIPARLLFGRRRRIDANRRGGRHVRCPGAPPVRHRHRGGPRAGPAPARPGGHLPLRPDRLRPAPPRPRPGHAGLRRPPPLPGVVRPAGAAGVQHHRHRRQDHRAGQPGGPRRRRDRPPLRGRLVPGDGRHRRRPADRHPPRHRLRRADGRADRPARRARPRLPHRRRRLPRRRRRSRTTACWPTSPSTRCWPAAATGRSSAPSRSATRPTSRSGRWPSPASRAGPHRGATAARAGTPSAWPCRSTCWATASTSTAAGSTSSSRTTRTSGPRPSPSASASPTTGCTTPSSSTSRARRCPSRSATSRTCSTSSRRSTAAPSAWSCCRRTTAHPVQVGRGNGWRRRCAPSAASTPWPAAPSRPARRRARRRDPRRVRGRAWTTTSTRRGPWPSLFDTVTARQQPARRRRQRRRRAARRRGAGRCAAAVGPRAPSATTRCPTTSPAQVAALDAARAERDFAVADALRSRAAGRGLGGRDDQGRHAGPPRLIRRSEATEHPIRACVAVADDT